MVDVTLRPARLDDLELLLAWRSNPEIYNHFQNQEGPIQWESHIQWFATRPNDRRDFIIEYSGRRVGVVTITEDQDVSIYIGETALWGNGIATAALEEVIEMHGAPLYATVHQGNTASQALFEKCGFRKVEDGEWIRYRFEK